MNKTNSPTQPQLTPAQELAQLRQQYQAVSELLWETIRTAAPDTHEITIAPHASTPLWELAFVRAAGPDGQPDPTGRMRVLAATIPELTEQEKKHVVRFLRGTDKPIEDAMLEFKLPHPPSYLVAKIADRITWKAAAITSDLKTHPDDVRYHWESVTPPIDDEK